MTHPHFVAIEWGTARIRARVLTGEGGCAAEWQEAVRLADLDRDGIAARIATLAAMWPEAAAGGMVLAGMIGSALGWHEVARAECPADASAIAAAAWRGRIAAQPVTILPGLSCRSRFGDPDVLRGEEVASIGAITATQGRPALLVSVPGMHGKWIRLEGGRIVDFHTAMTVDLHQAIAARTILAPLASPPARDGDAFRRGVRQGAAGGLARRLFAARAAVQSGTLREEEAAAYIWGVLIGADVADGLPGGSACLVTGLSDIAALFVAAIETLGGAARALEEDALVIAGFEAIATQLGRQETPRQWADA